MHITYDQFMSALENSEINEKIEAMEKKPKIKDETPKLYNKLSSGEFKHGNTFTVPIPPKLTDGKTKMAIKVTIDMSKLNSVTHDYKYADDEFKSQLHAYSQWYDDFNNLIFKHMKSESDACLFMAAVAFTSARTALDKNVLEAAKIFSAVKFDFEHHAESLSVLSNNDQPRSAAQLFNVAVTELSKGSAYAGLLLKKLDYIKTKPGIKKLPDGTREQVENSFSEITVGPSKIPNCNLFIQYYMASGGNVDKKELVKMFTSGTYGVGGTKIGSFFLNLLEPKYKWQGKKIISPATIDTWMIRVFFYDEIEKAVTNDVLKAITRMAKLEFPIVEAKADIDPSAPVDFAAALETVKTEIISHVTDTLLDDDTVRSKLILILNDEAEKIGLDAYQLQALAWVIFRKDPKYQKTKNARTQTANFGDVIKYVSEVANCIKTYSPSNLNDVERAIEILANTPRFFFGPDNIAHNRDSYKNRSDYQSITTKNNVAGTPK